MCAVQTYHKDRVPPEASMACGALAALVATAVTFPLEVVRRRAMGGQVHSFDQTPCHACSVHRQKAQVTKPDVFVMY